MINYWKI